MAHSTFRPEDFNTGICPPGYRTERSASEKDLVEVWHIAPLLAMKGDDGFACLTLCFPLIESIIRHEHVVPDDQPVSFSENSPALQWFADFMSIPEAHAREAWDGLRNGLLHRAMLKSELNYVLTGKKAGRNAEVIGDKIYIYVWELRDSVVREVRRLNKKLWKGTSSPLPKVYIEL